MEDPVRKTVGRRRIRDAVEYGFDLQDSLSEHFGGFAIRKGVYCFASHEEADAWMMERLTRRVEN